jgi:hypothetical protein
MNAQAIECETRRKIMQSKHVSVRFPEILGRLAILVSVLLLNIATPRPVVQAADDNPGYPVFLPVVSGGVAKEGDIPPPPPTCQQVANVASWNSEITVSYSIAAESSSTQISEKTSTSISGHLVETYRNPSAIGFMATTPAGNGKIDFSKVRLYPTDTYLEEELKGDGPPLPYDPLTTNGSRIMLSFNLQECTYSLYVGVWIKGTSADQENPPSPVDIGIIHAGSADYSIPDNSQKAITGSRSWPAHSSDYVMSQWTNIDFYTQDDYDIQTILGEDNMGAAQASWSFTPATGP